MFFGRKETFMYWTEVTRALLYGQPTIREERLQPQLLRAAIRNILRLIACGWIEALTDDAVQRIRKVCQASQCEEVWDEFQHENPLLIRRKRRKSLRRKAA
jgi:hypothetical protein